MARFRFDCTRLTDLISKSGEKMYAKAGAIWLQRHIELALIKDAATLSRLIADETDGTIAQSAISQYLSEQRAISPDKVMLLTRFFFFRHHSSGERLDEFFAFPSPTDSALLILYQAASTCLKEVVRIKEPDVVVTDYHTIALFAMQGPRWVRVQQFLETNRHRAAEYASEIATDIRNLAKKLGIRHPSGLSTLTDLLTIEENFGKYWLNIHRCLTQPEAN
jgi:hypothetical protein